MNIPSPVVDADWLATNLEAVAVVDCRWALADPTAGRSAFDAGHIPGAVYASLDDDLSDMSVPEAGRHPLPTKRRFADTMGRLGIANTSTVVAYDDAGGAHASRLWWLLRWVGHTDVAVLDGGIQAWTGDLEVGSATRRPANFAIGVGTMPTVEADGLVAPHPSTVVIDARAPQRYRGETEPLDPAAGHIPGAVNVPFAGNLENGRFAPAADLSTRFQAVGVADARAAVVYCGSGVTACHDILAMEVAGLGTAALYPGSWSEWSRAGREIATGD